MADDFHTRYAAHKAAAAARATLPDRLRNTAPYRGLTLSAPTAIGSVHATEGERPLDFVEFPKMARLSRDILITEKIDGTNACIGIEEGAEFTSPEATFHIAGLTIFAGSRSRWITPADDNFGFARWVSEHADDLAALGPGRHFGEWWGSGIQRGYGLPKGEKRFSLFNTTRWALHGMAPQPIVTADPTAVPKLQDVLPPCCGLVPVLYQGMFDMGKIADCLHELKAYGSRAAPGFLNPEGVVVFHTAANAGFKKTIERDEVPKGRAR